MLKTYFKSILRNLWKNRVTSAINVLALTLGLSSVMFLFIQNQYEKNFDANQPKMDQIYRVNVTMKYPNRVHRDGNTQSMLINVLRDEFHELEASFQAIGPMSPLVTINPGSQNEKVFEETRNMFYADSVFLKYMDYQFLAGNPRTALDTRNAVVLSTNLIDKYYPEYVGREIELLGTEVGIYDSLRVFVTGVIKTPKSNTNFPFEMLVSNEIYYQLNEWDRDNWGNISAGLTFAVLPPNMDHTQIDRRFPEVMTKYFDEEDQERTSYSLLNLKELHTSSNWGFFNGNYTLNSSMMIGFLAVGLFILISACINFINLQTAQAINRSKEVGIRKVMGGKRSQLIVQFLIETFILTSISFILALWLTELALDGWNDLLSIVRMDLQITLPSLVFGLVLIVTVSVLAGIYPALKLSSFEPSESLRSGFSLLSEKKGLSLRQVLVVTQFVITQVLIIGTIVIARQMDYFINKDMGFEKDDMITFTAYDPNSRQIDRLAQGIEGMPEVSSYSISSGPPMDAGRYATSFYEVGHEDKEMMRTRNKFIDHRFLEHFKIELAAGRNFRADEYNDTIDAFLVNEALVKQLEVKSPEEAIGKQLLCYGTKARIVGVVKDFHIDKMDKAIEPLIMFPWRSRVNNVTISVQPGQLSSVLPKFEALWLDVFPTRVFKFETVEELMEDAYVVENIMLKSIRIFSMLAILIGCLGLYGLVSFMANRKMKEIGIRKVLGATYQQVLYIFSRRFFILTFVAFIFSAPLAYLAMEAWLSNYVFRIPMDWQIFTIAFFATLLLTSVTVAYIATKTALTNPADTLQFE